MWTIIFCPRKKCEKRAESKEKCSQSDDQEHFNTMLRKNYFFRDSSTATATETVIPTMGLLPAPRKPIISTSNPPVGGFVPAAQGLSEQEARLFAKQEAHCKKAVCCAFLPWGHLITSCVHETRCFDLIKHLQSSFFRFYHLQSSFNHPPPRARKNKSKIILFYFEPIPL